MADVQLTVTGSQDVTVEVTDGVVPSLTLTVPQGITIETAVPGVQGPAGVGFPAGGTTAQVLAKASNTDRDTEWKTLSKSDVGLGDVDNVSLASWTGSTSITTLGTVSTGTIQVAAIQGLATSATTDTTNASNISSGTLAIGRGGTGVTGTPSNGQLLIGNGTGYTLATLTQGANISITNNAGSITIAATGGGGSAETVSPFLLMGA